MAICAGRPKKDKTWDEVPRHAAQLLEKARGQLKFENNNRVHRRGQFFARNFGISHGGGQPFLADSLDSPLVSFFVYILLHF